MILEVTDREFAAIRAALVLYIWWQQDDWDGATCRTDVEVIHSVASGAINGPRVEMLDDSEVEALTHKLESLAGPPRE